VRRGVVEGDGVCGGGQSMATACVMVFGFAVKVDTTDPSLNPRGFS
jgi:hypothetical protein